MNLYASTSPDAEAMLASAWAAEAAIAAQRLKARDGGPHNPNGGSKKDGSHRKLGILDGVRDYAKTIATTFTLHDIHAAMPQFDKKQLATALTNAVKECSVEIHGKTHFGLNIYCGVVR